MGEVCSKSGEEQNCLQDLARKYEEQRAFAIGRHKWQANIKLDLSHGEREDMKGIHLTQERDNQRALRKTVMKSQFALY